MIAAPPIPRASAGQASPRLLLLVGVLIAAGLAIVYRDGLAFMIHNWGAEEYSHGYLIPWVALYLAWQKQSRLLSVLRDAQVQQRLGGAAMGLIILGLALLLYLMGELGTVYTLIQYGFVLAIYGIAIILLGWRGAWVIAAALLYLLFMIPLPSFLYNNLSASLQLLSSHLGVAFLRLMQVSVYLEGNVIDLGTYKLQVAEACSGLRYLFPLLSFSFLVACFYRRALPLKALIVASALPITLLMNSIRIALIGLTVDWWGIQMAEGVLHAFEGWVIFLGCLGLLALEIWLIEKLVFRNGRLEVAMDFGSGNAESLKTQLALWRVFLPTLQQLTLRPLSIALVLIGATATVSLSLGQRDEYLPERSAFTAFPLMHDGWVGRENGLDAAILDTLKVSDYIQADYQHPDEALPVNLYVAYYASQRKGASVHSPRSCIPGDGWVIKDLTTIDLADKLGVSRVDGGTMTANRAVIVKGDARNLVYYWFDQRGRVFSNEYLAKWYIFWDSMTRGRSDGALVRLVTPLAENESVEVAEQRLLNFARDFDPLWGQFLPD